MKRSEMKKIIHDAITEWVSISRYGELVIESSEILDIIEKAGMLPPEEYVNVIDLGDGRTITDEFCEWEPEE